MAASAELSVGARAAGYEVARYSDGWGSEGPGQRRFYWGSKARAIAVCEEAFRAECIRAERVVYAMQQQVRADNPRRIAGLLRVDFLWIKGADLDELARMLSYPPLRRHPFEADDAYRARLLKAFYGDR